MNNLDNIKKQRQGIQEHLSYPIEQSRSKIDVSDREIKGYAIVWDSVNDYKEIVKKGATLKSLNARGVNSSAGNKIQLLLQHDKTKILGEIVELREDDYGLFFRAMITEGIQHCEEALINIRKGLLNQLSYGFNYIWDEGAVEYDSERDMLILNEIKLYEISLVTFSSDPNAQLRSYANSQAQLRLAQFSNEQIRTIISAFNIMADADEAKPESAFNSLSNKF